MDSKNEKEKKQEELLNAGIAGAGAEVVQRYGSAAKEYLVAYSGQDNEHGVTLKRGLKQIAESSVNPKCKKQNYKQQAGFSAEVAETANTNAENIIKKKSERKVRTDDMGSVNDQFYDFKCVDGNGNVIPGSESQMKFVGSNPKEALNKLAQKKFEKYLEKDVKIEVPSDYYEGMIEEANKKIDQIKKQIENQKQKGNAEQVAKLKKQLEKYTKIKKNLRKSTVSTKEAMFARQHPKLYTAGKIMKVSHRAGLETAKEGALIGGSVSLVKNVVAVVKGEEEMEDAVKCVAKDTGKAAVIGYGTGFAGSALKGTMQNAKSTALRDLSKTNFPGMMVMLTLSVGETMSSYLKGDIDGLECLEQLGEQGTGMLASSIFSVIGQVVIPIPVVGSMIGGMLGYALSSATYGLLVNALREAKLAEEQRRLIEQECAEHIRLMREYRLEMETIISKYLASNLAVFLQSFDDIKTALEIGDADGFISGANGISRQLGREPQFSDFQEFDALMNSDKVIKI